MLIRTILTTGILVQLLLGASALAQTGATSSSEATGAMANDSKLTATTAEAVGGESQINQKRLPITLSLLSFLYGPTVGDPGSGITPTSWVSDEMGLSLQNQVSVRYDITDQLSIAPTFDFEVLMTDPAGYYRPDQYVALTYDSFIRTTYVNAFNTYLSGNEFWLNADFRYYVPTSDFSRNHNSLGSARFTLTPNLQFQNSGFSVALVNFARYWLQTQDLQTGTRSDYYALPQLMFYTAPLVNYQVSDSFSIWAMLEASMTYDTRGYVNTSDPERSLVDIEPGFDLKIGKNVTISPYLNWFTNRPLSTTSINVMTSIAI